MLVICVITAVIGFVIYNVMKIKIEDWNEEYRMNKLSLKKRLPIQKTKGESESLHCSPEIIEVSSDESNTSKNGVIDNDELSEVEIATNKYYNEDTLEKFQKSTDSVASDEDEGDYVFASSSKPLARTSMFRWNQNISLERNNLKKYNDNECDESDISDCDNMGLNSYRSIHKRTHVEKSSTIKYDDDYNSEDSNLFHPNQSKKFKGSNDTELSSVSEPKEDDLPEVQIKYEQLISGIKVKLPVKPYSCQIAVMNKLIQGCVKKENCLLESPTGTGKTLALLCSVLAWHDHHIAEVRKKIRAQTEQDYTKLDSSEDYDKHLYDNSDKCADECGSYLEEELAEASSDLKIPKIFYCTRTHKQIEQVVRELKKTSYKHKKMTILSSREHTCIQESTKNKTELCNELLDTTKFKGCPFYNDVNRKSLSNFHAVERLGLKPVWDIEDLVTIGKNTGLCPYFGARNLMDHADIIFCPYNYIIDPFISEALQINIKGQVIILDEAHNIEDSSRDAASVSFRDDYLTAAANECDSLMNQIGSDRATYATMKTYLLNLVEFLTKTILDKIDYNGVDVASSYWTGPELLELFNMNGLGESAYLSFIAASSSAISASNKAKDENRYSSSKTSVKPIISTSTKVILDHLLFAIQKLSSAELINDYRAYITETTVKDYKYAADNTWYSAKKKVHRVRTLKLLCMNPGIIFSPLATSARSIILASGTLTPTGSFQSELNTEFVHILNTAHVIPKGQVYATCVPRGPTGTYLRATYTNVNSWKFQDELGETLVHICESVPHGILCFFSSYNMMHKQTERWKCNSIWSRITSTKQVFVEPRYGGDLASIMEEYRELIQDTSAGPRGKVDGALLLAVFRGKVAEGIDFKDNEARCVVTVGIPYAVRKDPIIEMKWEYNDENTKRGLLKGSDWYSIQAFRALNQALGRCLRHINDWGAVLLIDERFLIQDNHNNLPKWVKTMVISNKMI